MVLFYMKCEQDFLPYSMVLLSMSGGIVSLKER